MMQNVIPKDPYFRDMKQYYPAGQHVLSRAGPGWA